MGRFITADPTVQHPTDPQDLNRYAYARNNPIRFTDPTGLGFWSVVLGIVGAVIGFAIGAGPQGALLLAVIFGAVGGIIDAATQKQNLARGAMEGAVEGEKMAGLVTSAAAAGASAGGAGGAGGGGSGDVGGMSAAFTDSSSQGYVYIDGSAMKAGAWEGLKGAVGKGMGLAGDVMKAVGSQMMPAAYASVTIGVQTLAPGSGGLNSDQQLSRFKENTKSKENPEIVTLYHYGYMADSASIGATGLRPGSFATPDFYTSGTIAEDSLSLPPSVKYPGKTRDARYLLQVDLSKTETIDLGRVPRSKVRGQKGGGNQVIFPNGVPADAIKSVEPLQN